MTRFTVFRNWRRPLAVGVSLGLVLSVAACGGASDSTSGDTGEADGATKLSLVAYAVPKPGTTR